MLAAAVAWEDLKPVAWYWKSAGFCERDVYQQPPVQHSLPLQAELRLVLAAGWWLGLHLASRSPSCLVWHRRVAHPCRRPSPLE